MNNKAPLWKQPIFWLIVIWLIVNGLQAGLTELDPDEAYYWVYSRQLAWGYFDHPAAVALLIKMGYALIPTELGVRLFPVLLSAGTIYLLWLLADRPRWKADFTAFALLVAAMPFLNVYSFIATPDSPLLFFATLYFYLFRRFQQEASWWNTFLLGTCMAALLHSKYHGVLLIFFCLLSDWRLLLNYKFYVASIWGFLLFFPHLYWQYANDFPSFRYHLSGRDDAYQLKYTGNYLLNQVLMFSPLLFPITVTALWRYRAKDRFQQSWKWVILGFWGLFLVLTSKGHAEPQWTALLSMPIVLLIYHFIQDQPSWRKWTVRLSITTIVLLFMGRIFLLLPLKDIDSEFHKRIWVEELQTKAEGLPVLFIDSYRDPSKYAFYSGAAPYSYTDVKYRKNQYDLWDWEKDLHNQTVFIVGPGEWACAACTPLKLSNRGPKNYQVVQDLQVSQNVWIDYFDSALPTVRGDSIFVTIDIQNPYPHTIVFGEGDLPLQLVGLFFENGEWVATEPLQTNVQQVGPQTMSPVDGVLSWPGSVTKPEDEGRAVQLFMGIQMGDLPPAVHSEGYGLKEGIRE